MSSENLFTYNELESSKEIVATKIDNQKANEVTITSLEIAELTGKDHKHIMRDIRESLDKVVDGGVSKFGHTYINPQNKQSYPCYKLPKREALILVSGYSVELRAKIIDRLEYLENQLKSNTPQLPQTYAEALRELADKAEKVAELENKVAQDKPKVEYADKILSASNSVSFADFGKMLGSKGIKMGQNRLFALLKEQKYLMPNNEPYQKYVDCGYFELLPQNYNAGGKTITTYKTLITAKGQHYFTNKLISKRG